MLVLLLLLVAAPRLRSSPSALAPYPRDPYASRALQGQQWDLEQSCLLSRQLDTQASYAKFCQFADWSAARAFRKSDFSYADSGAPISSKEQIGYAEFLYKEWLRSAAALYSASLEETSACSEALQRLACTTAFPECPLASSTATSIAFLPPCRLQCEQAQSACGGHPARPLTGPGGAALDCAAYQTENCFVYVPTGYFLLSARKGPYGSMAAFYAALALAWAAALAWWVQRAFYAYAGRCLKICRTVAVVPLAKLTTLLFALAFWVTCSRWKMCSAALAVAVVNAQLVYESACVWLMNLVAGGWEEVDADAAGIKMKIVTATTLAFYVASSALQLAKEAGLGRPAYVACAGALYAAVYLRVAWLTYARVREVEKSVSLLEQHSVPQGFVKPVQRRYAMHAVFLALMLMSMAAEVAVQALMGSQAGFGVTILVYELLNTLLVGSVLYVFRPQEYSPFYFMQPIDRRAAMRQADRRGGALSVKVVDDADESPGKAAASSVEVELLPLLARRDERSTSTSLVVVHGPSSVAVGSQADIQP